MATKSENQTMPFVEDELALIARLIESIQSKVSNLSATHQTRVLLGVSGELVDAAAELEATLRSGETVVRLGLLAERLSQLAQGQQDIC